MEFRRIGLVACVVLMGCAAFAAATQKYPPIIRGTGMLPLPSKFTYGVDSVLLSDALDFSITCPKNEDILVAAVERFRQDIKSLPYPRTQVSNPAQLESENLVEQNVAMSKVIVTVADGEDNEYPQEETDESYTLEITGKDEIKIEATTSFGALRAIQTLYQLVRVRKGSSPKLLEIPGCPWMISDTPRFKHRGILLDTSRNFFDVPSILKVIDGISQAKMNVFHWHIVDSQSFPLHLDSLPDLARLGAYSPDEIYSKADIKNIVEYARLRGVRVIPEIDAPGHTFVMGLAFPEIMVCGDAQPYYTYCQEPPCGNLDPSNDKTYEVLDSLIGELASMFPDNHVHLGADEVNFKCWDTSENIRAWMKEKDFGDDYKKAFEFFEQKYHSIAKAHGKKVINWQEVFSESLELGEDYTVQVWLGQDIPKVTQAGFKGILSNYDAWYLDCGHGSWIDGGNSWCDPFKTWQAMYKNEPFTSAMNQEQKDLVLGGEACMWAEQVDSNNVENSVFPRIGAVAERLWSHQDATDEFNMASRLWEYRDRLVNRGIKAEPLQPVWCELNQGSCLTKTSVGVSTESTNATADSGIARLLRYLSDLVFGAESA
eukprot:GFYU01008786.1.p1 GENE.GFYU01008786.1~~GFYU01008786.1.p1  ORF type:complete len:600 (+),score=201.97 GFYU01008786.1:95-1894(+)